MHAVIFGGSRGVGYFTTLYLLSLPGSTWTASLLLRTPAKIEKDERLSPFIISGRLKLFKGDANNHSDAVPLFEQGTVDVVISSMGSTDAKPTLSGFKFKGAQDPCTGPIRVLLPILQALPRPAPRVIVLSTMGINGTHECMPLLHRIGYPWALKGPHRDKEGLEYAIFRASTHIPTPSIEPIPNILSAEAISALPENFLDETIIVRPAWFVGDDKESTEEDPKPKVGEKITVSTIKRADVARFIVDSCLPGDNTWVNKQMIIGF